MRIATDNQLAGRHQTLFGKHDVLDAAAADVEEILDMLFVCEVFHQLSQARRLGVLCRDEMIGNQRDLAGIKDELGAFDLAHHPDCDGRRKLVGENEVNPGVDNLPRLDTIATRMTRQNLFG